MRTYTMQELETAINWWSSREGDTADRIRLSRPVSALAEPYATLIVSGRGQVSVAELSAECVELLTLALEAVHGAG